MEAPMVLMTVHGSDGAPSLAQAASELGVSVADIDDKFGIVPINPAEGLYAVQVKETSIDARAAAGADRSNYRGPYSNPQIAPFGPVQSATEPGDEQR
jgi:hypothetical protein